VNAGFPEPDTPGPYVASLRQAGAQASLAAENARLRGELAQIQEELKAAAADLNTAEAELEQAIRLYPTPDEVVVLREDLRIVLTGQPDDSGVAERLEAAAGL
jgi:multidrug resistance efflux pump